MSYNKETGLFDGYIYLITNKINSKQYVGQTIGTIKERWSQHVHPSKTHKNKTVMDKAIDKYGKEAFILKEICKFSANNKKQLKTLLNEAEINYIKQYNTLAPNGYNIDKGGDTHNSSCVSVDMYDILGNFIQSFESKKLASQIMNINVRTINAICHGKIPNYNRKYVFRDSGDAFDLYDCNSYYMKKTYAYKLDGTLYKVFDTRNDAIKDTGCTFIGNIIDDVHRIGMGYWWASKPGFKYLGVEKKKILKIDLYNSDGVLIHKFDSVTGCSKYLKTSTTAVSSVCSGKTMSIKGFVPRYEGDAFDLYPINKQKLNHSSRIVNQYTIDNNYIGQYPSIRSAASDNKTNPSIISKACKTHSLHKNTYWYYADDLSQPDKSRIVA